MSQTIAEKVSTRISALKGTVWSAADLYDLGRRSGVDQALRRLWHAGKIRKVARDLHDYLQPGTVVGIRAPRADRAVLAAARGRGASVRPSGSFAANALGLSTQVPSSASTSALVGSCALLWTVM